jgi:trigger factor
VAELVDALDLGSSGVTRESSSLSFRTSPTVKEVIMTVTVETLTALERKMIVSVPSENIDSQIKKRIQHLMKTAKVDGFRSGKVPETVIKQRFGYNIEFEAINEAVHQGLHNALKEKDLKPAGSPQLHFDEKYQTGNPFTFSATFEVYPEVTLQDFSHLVIEKTVAEISEEDIEKTLDGMRKQQVTWQEVNRPSKEGDKIWIKFEGTVEGESFEGGKSENMPLILGSHSTIPGFEDGLLNANVNQDLVLNVTFPENYGVKTLAGKPAKFNSHINKIEEPQLPELNDAFAEKFGVKEGGLQKLREEVTSTLKKQLSYALKNKIKAEVMAKLAEAYKNLEVPKALIQRESEHLMKQTQQQFAQYKGATLPQFNIEMFADRAKERVILGLVVNEIIQRDQLKPEAAKVRELIEEMASRFDEPEKVMGYYYQNKERLAEMESMALEEQIVDKIAALATIVEKPGKASEILSMEGGK